MASEISRETLEISLDKLEALDPQKRDMAFQSIAAYIQYIHSIAMSGAGPVALPSTPSISSTSGTFKCPKCGNDVKATFS
jgi:hypothetical protein